MCLQSELLVVVEVAVNIFSNGQQRNRCFGEALAEQVHSQEGLILGNILIFEQSFLELCVGGWNGVREPDFVILVRHEGILEAESEIGIDSFTSPVVVVKEGVVIVFVGPHLLVFSCEVGFSQYVVLRISHIFASSEPAHSFILESAFGPNTWFHTDLVQTGRFC